ncbi:MAG: hypothetical protein QXG11_03315 [Candidatus Bathyarchaeia archaeon]
MYNDLFERWKSELRNKELERLPEDFVQRIVDYLKEITKERKMLDKRTVKAILLKIEERNVKRMLNDLTKTRCSKLIKKAKKGEKIQGLLPSEENVYSKLVSSLETYQTFATEILQGRHGKIKSESKFVVLRILQRVPQIIGSDMKVYGPFKAEDIAILPFENAKILVKQGLATEINVG